MKDIILVIEDSKLNSDVLNEYIREMGYTPI